MAQAQKLFYQGGLANPDRKHPLVVYMFGYTQGLYKAETAAQVDKNCKSIANHLNEIMPFRVEYIGTTKDVEDSARIVALANQNPDCIAIAGIPHTFSPGGLHSSFAHLGVPYFHIVTTLDSTMPSTVNRDFMNLMQSAHAGNEVAIALNNRGVYHFDIVEHWKSPDFAKTFERYGRAAAAKAILKDAYIWCMGGKMPDVQGTDVNRATLQNVFGPRVTDGTPADLLEIVQSMPTGEVASLADLLIGKYDTAADLKKDGEFHHDLQYAVCQYLALSQKLRSGNFIAWTDYFGNIKPLTQLPALASQLTMRDGYGFGPEGDVCCAAVVAAFKVMGLGRKGAASSNTEPYILDFDRKGELYAHMAETCVTMAGDGPIKLRRDPLEIGPSDPMAKLVFKYMQGPCILTTLSTIPTGLHLVTTEGTVMETPDLSDLTTAAGLIGLKPNLQRAKEAAYMLNTPHHPGIAVGEAVTTQDVDVLARMLNMPHTVINDGILDPATGQISQSFRERAENLTGLARNRKN